MSETARLEGGVDWWFTLQLFHGVLALAALAAVGVICWQIWKESR